MSVSLPLTVPQPALGFKPVAGGFASIDGAVKISFPVVRFPDGTAMRSDDFVAAQVLLMRLASPSSTSEMWDPAAKVWRDQSTIDPSVAKGLALIPPEEGSDAWTGVLSGAGQVDAAGAPLLAPSLGGFPQYRLRGVFHAKRDTSDALGVGPESPALQFISSDAATRFKAQLTPDADAPTRVQLMLRTASATPAGVVDIDASGANGVLTVRNFDSAGNVLASIALEADGSVRLTPLGGMKVVIAGDLEAEQITYLPTLGLPKKTLN
jgi:hypothetical protein